MSSRRDAERRLDVGQAVLDSLPGVFYVFTAQGKFLQWNRGLEVASMYEADAIARMHPLQLIRERDRELVASNIETVFRSGAGSVEACLLSRDGTETPYLFTGKRLSLDGEPCLIGMGIDMQERNRATSALRSSEEQLRVIIERSPISMAIVGMDGVIEYINRRAVETFGYRHEDIPVMDRWWVQAYPDERYRRLVVEQWTGLVERALALGEEIERREYQVTCKDGTVKTMLIFGVIAAGKVFVMFEDITARKAAEEARARAEEQLHQAQRMEALGTLSGGIAHDFNNILMGVMPTAELLLKLTPEDDRRHALADTILQSSLRARDLVQQILAFSRREKPRLARSQLARVVEETRSLLQASIPPNVTIELRLEQDVPHVMFEHSQVLQVVTNLVTNSAHAIGQAPGKIELALDVVELTERDAAATPAARAGRFVRLTVEDTGSGMCPETVARAFEPFFTTKPVGQGTGLGLAIVHGIMTRHDGFILVRSALGRGSTFELYFPADAGDAREARAPHALPAAKEALARRVLLVDDEPVVLRMTTALLEHRGCLVAAFSDAKQALGRVRESSTVFDLAIVDLAMPGMYGDELARHLHASRPELPILLASGNADGLDPKRLREVGIVGILAKPFGVDEAFEAIDRAVATPPGTKLDA